MACVLVQDPCNPYAVELMDRLYRRHGHRAVCFFTDRRIRARAERAVPALRSEAVAASYDVPLRHLARFADFVRRRYDVAGVVPFNEDTVMPSAQLADWLELGWNPLETMRRFRDKHALKQYLRTAHPHLRM